MLVLVVVAGRTRIEHPTLDGERTAVVQAAEHRRDWLLRRVVGPREGVRHRVEQLLQDAGALVKGDAVVERLARALERHDAVGPGEGAADVHVDRARQPLRRARRGSRSPSNPHGTSPTPSRRSPGEHAASRTRDRTTMLGNPAREGRDERGRRAVEQSVRRAEHVPALTGRKGEADTRCPVVPVASRSRRQSPGRSYRTPRSTVSAAVARQASWTNAAYCVTSALTVSVSRRLRHRSRGTPAAKAPIVWKTAVVRTPNRVLFRSLRMSPPAFTEWPPVTHESESPACSRLRSERVRAVQARAGLRDEAAILPDDHRGR